MTMLIEVTLVDIALGQRAISYACPVARALKRHTGIEWAAEPAGQSEMAAISREQTIMLPPEVAEWVDQFDAEETCALCV